MLRGCYKFTEFCISCIIPGTKQALRSNHIQRFRDGLYSEVHKFTEFGTLITCIIHGIKQALHNKYRDYVRGLATS